MLDQRLAAEAYPVAPPPASPAPSRGCWLLHRLPKRLLAAHAAEGLHVLRLGVPAIGVVPMRYRHAVTLERAMLSYRLHAHGAQVIGPEMRIPFLHRLAMAQDLRQLNVV